MEWVKKKKKKKKKKKNAENTDLKLVKRPLQVSI